MAKKTYILLIDNSKDYINGREAIMTPILIDYLRSKTDLIVASTRESVNSIIKSIHNNKFNIKGIIFSFKMIIGCYFCSNS